MRRGAFVPDDLANLKLTEHANQPGPEEQADQHHRNGQDVRDHTAEREADRRRAERIDERIVPLVAIADAPDQCGELWLHRR